MSFVLLRSLIFDRVFSSDTRENGTLRSPPFGVATRRRLRLTGKPLERRSPRVIR